MCLPHHMSMCIYIYIYWKHCGVPYKLDGVLSCVPSKKPQKPTFCCCHPKFRGNSSDGGQKVRRRKSRDPWPTRPGSIHGLHLGRRGVPNLFADACFKRRQRRGFNAFQQTLHQSDPLLQTDKIHFAILGWMTNGTNHDYPVVRNGYPSTVSYIWFSTPTSSACGFEPFSIPQCRASLDPGVQFPPLKQREFIFATMACRSGLSSSKLGPLQTKSLFTETVQKTSF